MIIFKLQHKKKNTVTFQTSFLGLEQPTPQELLKIDSHTFITQLRDPAPSALGDLSL